MDNKPGGYVCENASWESASRAWGEWWGRSSDPRLRSHAGERDRRSYVGRRKIHEQNDEAIRLHDKLLLILSEHSMSSNWVKTEIANARTREEREHKQLLFPITLAAFEEVKN